MDHPDDANLPIKDASDVAAPENSEVSHINESFEVLDIVPKDKEQILENEDSCLNSCNKSEESMPNVPVSPVENLSETAIQSDSISNVISAPQDDLEMETNTESKILEQEQPCSVELLSKEVTKQEIDHETSTVNDDLLPSLGILPEDDTPACSLEIKNKLVDEKNMPSLEGSRDVRMPNTTKLKPSEISHKEKRIKWKDIEVRIITQNNNGPCPLIAILNAMILKGTTKLPSNRQEFTGGELVTIVANAVMDVPRSSIPTEMHGYLEQNSQDAFNILDKLLTGLDVNIKFSGVKDFEFTPELSVFDVLGVSLYHGWVIDPSHEAYDLVASMSYNQLTMKIINWNNDAVVNQDNSLAIKAALCQTFLENSVSQLTFQGLYELGATLVDEEIAVLFRNNHFATVYKREGRLYLLLTDQGYLHTNAVWETLADVDSTFSEFVDGAFQPIQNCEPSQMESAAMTTEQQISSDLELATMLQEEDQKTRQREEDVNKMLSDMGLKDMSDEEIARQLQERENRLAEEANRALEEEQQQQQRQQAATTSPRSSQSSRISPQRRSSSEHQDKKKKDCVIL